jgi:hypothetical protein
MKLPADSFIDPRKITHYLLKPQAKSDKSRFLFLAGYDLGSAAQLLNDLRTQVLPLDAMQLQTTQHGVFFEISAFLRGPNHRSLPVRTIWIKEHLSGLTKFVTLVPRKETLP